MDFLLFYLQFLVLSTKCIFKLLSMLQGSNLLFNCCVTALFRLSWVLVLIIRKMTCHQSHPTTLKEVRPKRALLRSYPTMWGTLQPYLCSSSCYMMETTGSRCWANLYPVLTHQREPTCSQIFVASTADASVDAFPSHFHSASAPEMGRGGCIRKCFEVIPINVAPSGQNVQLQI